MAGLVVLSRGSIVELPRPPWFGETCIGAQPADPPRGTLSCVAAGGGVIEDGGVCASAAPAAMKIVEIKSNARVCMENKRRRATVVPRRDLDLIDVVERLQDRDTITVPCALL